MWCKSLHESWCGSERKGSCVSCGEGIPCVSKSDERVFVVKELLEQRERMSLAGALRESNPSAVHVEFALCVRAEGTEGCLCVGTLGKEIDEMGVVGSWNGL